MSDNNDLARFNEAVGFALNVERVISGVTFDQLAEQTGISKRTLMRLLSKNEADMRVGYLMQITQALGTTPSAVVAAAERYLEQGDLSTDPTDEQLQRAGRRLRAIRDSRAKNSHEPGASA